MYKNKETGVLNIPKIITHSVILVVLLAIVLASLGTISTGKVGIKTTLGKVTGTVQPGFYVKTPFIQQVVEMDTQIQKEQASAGAASKDLQTVNAEVAINYKIDSSKVQDLFTTIGVDYKIRVIDPAIQEVVKAVTAQYTAEELITKRPEVTDKIQAGLSQRLSVSDIIVSSVSVTNFDFSKSFNAAIEAKVTAEQNALAAKNKLEQKKYEADQVVVTAKAEAESIGLKSQAANNEKYVSLKALEVEEKAIEKWNGQLPNQMIPGQTLPFINLTK